ncbi:MAG: hypothetical protein Q9214_000267 [Letrouitia sp. 1 TL-2023]
MNEAKDYRKGSQYERNTAPELNPLSEDQTSQDTAPLLQSAESRGPSPDPIRRSSSISWKDFIATSFLQIVHLFRTPTSQFCLAVFFFKRVAFTSEGFMFQSNLLTNHKISFERRLITAIPIKSGEVPTESQLITFVEEALPTDDVFHKAFLTGVVFYGSEDHPISPRMQDYLSTHENKWTQFVKINDSGTPVFPGPYILERGWLWQVSRLFEDTVSAFTTGLRKSFEYSVTLLQVQGLLHTSAISVPSRLRAPNAGRDRPLRGLRVAVKEIFDVAGMKTGLGSRHYTELYPPATVTAPAVQRLIDAGAELIGITKMCSMVLKAPPTQCVDFSAPFNPRGDGYQSPSGGSSGQAAAIAAYSWLDFAIGSDCELDFESPISQCG